MTIQNNLNNYLTAYFQAAFKYLQSGDCEHRIGMAIATLLHWLINYLVIPTGALIVYLVLSIFTFITETRYPAPVDIKKPMSVDADIPASKSAPRPTSTDTGYQVSQLTSEEVEEILAEVNTEEKKEEKEEIRVKRITSYEIEYGPRASTKEVHVDRNREADFGEGYFTNLEEADEEAPF